MEEAIHKQFVDDIVATEIKTPEFIAYVSLAKFANNQGTQETQNWKWNRQALEALPFGALSHLRQRARYEQ
ncbi:hypothetical protein, partial [Corynebacterium heidelbergense]